MATLLGRISALPAQTPELYVLCVDLPPRLDLRRLLHRIEIVPTEISDALAGCTDEVVVRIQMGIETDAIIAGMQPPDKAASLERVDRPIDGIEGNRWDSSFDPCADFLGGRMAPAGHQLPIHFQALMRQPQPLTVTNFP